MSVFLDKNKKLISIVLISLMMYMRCAMSVHTSIGVVLDVAVDGLAFLYIVLLFVRDKEIGFKALKAAPVIWAALFFTMLIGYKLVGMGGDFSTRVAILTIGPGVLIYLILRYNEGNVRYVVTISSIIILASYIATAIWYDNGTIRWWFVKCYGRFGLTPGGRVLDTANLCSLMMVPILYELIVKKKLKGFLPITFITACVVFTTGSKAALGAIGFTVIIFFIFRSDKKKDILINIAIIVILAIIGCLLIFKVKMLYTLMGERIVELFTTAGNTNYDYTTSTGQRMASMHAALEHWSEKPIFGHGFYDFLNHDYSLVQASYDYSTGKGVLVGYVPQMLHCNFIELLFSFGLFGVTVYYWFPVTLVIKSFMAKDKETKLIALTYLLTMLVIDISLDMYYKYLTPYFTYMVVYCLLKEKNEKQRHC